MLTEDGRPQPLTPRQRNRIRQDRIASCEVPAPLDPPVDEREVADNGEDGGHAR